MHLGSRARENKAASSRSRCFDVPSTTPSCAMHAAQIYNYRKVAGGKLSSMIDAVVGLEMTDDEMVVCTQAWLQATKQ
jgi:hypothetical protein